MKARLSITEKLSYTRIVDVELPEGMTEEEFESLLEEADRDLCMNANDYVKSLEKSGVVSLDSVDESLDSPDDAEVECEDYEPIDDNVEE